MVICPSPTTQIREPLSNQTLPWVEDIQWKMCALTHHMFCTTESIIRDRLQDTVETI